MSSILSQKNSYIIKKYEDFTVYSQNDNYSFFHIDISDTPSFYEKMFDFFFNENRLLNYAENKANVQFVPNTKNFVTLYKFLGIYIDDFNIQKSVKDIEPELLRILANEYSLEDKGNGNFYVRLDKIGKIGEYLFCSLLSEFFGFNCIIPKVHLTTDPNMSVYGIDTLFYSKKDNLILFGESKLSISISNGIKLIKKSLDSYEQQLADEYTLILSNRFLKNNLRDFDTIYGNVSEISLNIQEFIKKASISRIGIPIFIAHGQENKVDDIMRKFGNIDKQDFFGLKTLYFFISLPIINKSKLVATFTKKIKERRGFYENEYAKY